MTVVFSSPHLGIVVRQQADMSYKWSGNYNGAVIKRAIPANEGTCCILLLDPDASRRSVFENLLSVDQKGNLVWTAKLPANPDAFLEISPVSQGISANTWSGFQLLLDRDTGAELRRIFTK
jgi:hypothetical protein